MMIKYCNKCNGRPYTDDLTASACPTCKNTLSVEIVSPDSLAGRPKLHFPQVGRKTVTQQGPYNPVTKSSGNSSFFQKSTTNIQHDTKTSIIPPTPSANVVGVSPNRRSNNGNNSNGSNPLKATITGKVSQYTNTLIEGGNYRRFFLQKILDALLYRQRTEDILHKFNVRVKRGIDALGNDVFEDIVVNIHGTLSSGSGISDNKEVEVLGTFTRSGVLMARKVYVLNNGFKTPVVFQRSAKAILYGILAIFAVIFLIYIGFSSGGGFFENIGSFLKIWLISAIAVTILYFVAIFSKIGIIVRMATGKQRKFPWIGILLISLVIALIVFNVAGIGSALSRILSSVISAVILFVVIFIVFKLLLGIF